MGTSFETTDWVEILRLYDELARLHPSPVVLLNRAVAVGFAQGPEAGLSALASLSGELDRYHAFHTAHADMLERLGHREEAGIALRKALELVDNEVERRFLERGLGSISD